MEHRTSTKTPFVSVKGCLVALIFILPVFISGIARANESTGCSAPSITSTTIVNANCYGDSTGAVTPNVSGTTPMTWAWSNGATTSTLTHVMAGTYTYTVTNACGSATGSATITQPDPFIASLSTTPALCYGGTGSATITATGGTTPYSGTGVFSGFSPGIIYSSVSDAHGCVSIASGTVGHGDPYEVDVTATFSSICNGSSTTLTATGGTSYTWSGPSLSATTGASVVASPTSSTSASFTYTVTGTNSAGCPSEPSTITIGVVSLGSISGPNVVCTERSITLTNTSSGGTWSSANSNVSVDGSAGVVTGVSAGTAIVTYLVSAGCTSNYTVTVNQSPYPIMGIATVCQGSGLSLSNGSAGGTWSSSNSNITVSVSGGIATIYGVNNGTANISYTLPNGCSSYKTFTVAPLAAITGPTQVCTGSTIQLSHPLSGAQWSVNMPTMASINISTGVLSGTAASNVIVTYRVNPGCYVTYPVTVATSPSSVAGPTTVCTGTSMTLTNPTAGGTWVSDNTPDATVGSATGIVTGVDVGVANISYVMPNGCFRKTAVTVNQTPAAVTGPDNVCVSRATAYSTTTTGGSWSSSSSALTINAGTGVASGVTAGTANVVYTVASGCYSSKAVTVAALPAAITGTTTMCEGANTTLSSTSASLTWSSSDEFVATAIPATTTTGTISGIGAGVATISYTSAVGCTQTINVTVYAAPTTITGNASVCVGATTTYSNSVTGGTWSCTPNTVASVISSTGVVTGVGAGSFTLTYITPGGCKTTRTLGVDAQPAAITGTLSTCVGGNTTLATTTAGGAWSTASATASVNASSGLVTGLSTGTAVISYTNTTGCVRTANVSVAAGLPVIAGPSSICIGGSTTLTDATTGGTWVSSNTTAATIAAGTGLITGAASGATTITYRTSATCFTTKDITVTSAPAAITGPSTSVCIGTPLQLEHATTGGTWTSSATTRATVNASTGLVSGVAVGSVTISYTPTPGCLTTVNITVNTPPAALTGTLTVCQNNSTTLTSTTSGGTWTSGNTDIATVATGSATTGIVTGGITTGIVTISYTNSVGCSRTAAVTVNAGLPAITGYDVVCMGNTTTLVNTTSGGTWSSSVPAKGSISTIGVAAAVATGTTTITYKTSSTCYVTKTMSVNSAVAAITGTTSVCKDNTVTLSCTTTGGTWATASTNAGVVDVSGAVTGLAAGTAVITYQLTGMGCYKTSTVTVLASPAPIEGIFGIAIGTSTTLTNTVGGGTWTSSNSTIASIGSTSGLATGVNLGSATITYKLANACYKTVLVNIIGLLEKPVNETLPSDISAIQVRIFPNPSQGNITIETPANGIFMVYAMDGKQVAKHDVTAPASSVTLPYDLAAGMYLCRFEVMDGSSAIVRLVYKP